LVDVFSVESKRAPFFVAPYFFVNIVIIVTIVFVIAFEANNKCVDCEALDFAVGVLLALLKVL